ncbi:uncharacterized protein [Apteryx mantelli]|uniref:Uncharacterized protein n=1 Tax=Apteryx mantelli TaxID=2696672 RepID=A0ABM4EF83_9AVES
MAAGGGRCVRVCAAAPGRPRRSSGSKEAAGGGGGSRWRWGRVAHQTLSSVKARTGIQAPRTALPKACSTRKFSPEEPPTRETKAEGFHRPAASGGAGTLARSLVGSFLLEALQIHCSKTPVYRGTAEIITLASPFSASQRWSGLSLGRGESADQPLGTGEQRHLAQHLGINPVPEPLAEPEGLQPPSPPLLLLKQRDDTRAGLRGGFPAPRPSFLWGSGTGGTRWAGLCYPYALRGERGGPGQAGGERAAQLLPSARTPGKRRGASGHRQNREGNKIVTQKEDSNLFSFLAFFFDFFCFFLFFLFLKCKKLSAALERGSLDRPFIAKEKTAAKRGWGKGEDSGVGRLCQFGSQVKEPRAETEPPLPFWPSQPQSASRC